MRFITDHEDFTRNYGEHKIHKVMASEKEGEAAVRDFILEKIAPCDMDNSYEDKFEVRFENGNCYKVWCEFWVSLDPEWRIDHDYDITPIPLDECVIKEAPGEFVMEERQVADVFALPVNEGDVIMGAVILSPAASHSKSFSVVQASRCMPLETSQSGEPCVKMRVNEVSQPLMVPLGMLMEQGCEVRLQLKVRPQLDLDSSPEISM